MRHDDEVCAVVVTDVVNRADVRMIEGRDRAGLAIESRATVGIVTELARQNLDGYRAIEPRIACLIDLAHATRAERLEEFIRAETRAQAKAHRVGTMTEGEIRADYSWKGDSLAGLSASVNSRTSCRCGCKWPRRHDQFRRVHSRSLES